MWEGEGKDERQEQGMVARQRRHSDVHDAGMPVICLRLSCLNVLDWCAGMLLSSAEYYVAM